MNTAIMEFDQDNKSFADYLAIFKRRRIYIAITATLIFLLALLVAISWPPTYRSTATILIEEQEIPQELVQSAITSFAAQRVQVITQRIMTVDTIAAIVERFGLYKGDDGAPLPKTSAAERFNRDMDLEMVSAEVIDPRSGKPTQATIAFTLSFDSENPTTAQKVTSELVTLYLNENLRTRTVRAESTAAFLNAEVRAVNNELLNLEAQLSAFKQAHEGSLPELKQFNLNSLERVDRELSGVNHRLQELAKRRIELTSELTRVPRNAPIVMPSGETLLSDSDRLRALQSEYQNLSAAYQDNHPDMEALRHEIQMLQNAINNRTTTVQEPIENPAYVLLENQLKALEAERESLFGQQQDLLVKKARLEEYLAEAPEVEKDYLALLRDYNDATAKFQTVKAKQREALLAENLELEHKGERFEVVEPPLLPLAPVSPNRPAILVLGIVLAAIGGLGAALAKDYTDRGIHGEEQLTAIVGKPPLVVVPYLQNDADADKQRQLMKTLLIAGAIVVIALVLYIHFMVNP